MIKGAAGRIIEETTAAGVMGFIKETGELASNQG
jgi:hypothetical protein